MISESIRRRINALRERTTARGFTEAEAMEAAAKVAELMREHGLHDSDLAMTQEAAALNGAVRSARASLWPVIARCTNTAALISSSLDGRVMIYVGKEPGPEIAAYLHDVCDTAINNEVKRFKKGDFYRRRRSTATRKQAVVDFTTGLVASLSGQLFQMFKPSISAIECRKAQEERNRRYPDSRSVKTTSHKTRFDHARYAGVAAGENVNISHGVRGREPQRLIGGAK
ncbi:DUF7168 domain-containing protein [Brucella inopinata]|uniref:DUF7168 domain-containing protein n=1 Tax=Brucella inopinata TaxID=1218315 RepID=UPI00046C976B|nr:DUF2786 domain-containing protein [Brucella inopinata]KEY05824.1 hypothetical protein IL59_0201180 [Brucella suis bv. 4 str. 40]